MEGLQAETITMATPAAPSDAACGSVDCRHGCLADQAASARQRSSSTPFTINQPIMATEPISAMRATMLNAASPIAGARYLNHPAPAMIVRTPSQRGRPFPR